ncbi:MAG TPA: 16S rRNA (guanine(966)-N(2))-methyltransferase RsmD [Acidimicrobiales bacterium]|nr:16S rRNA (guanine(966)-N(2))-methyltransferase RsmD [Acidimicrobiales bacterium]
MGVVRVVAGSARGRRLLTPPGNAVRPTADRVREAVGNALGSMSVLVGARVLDLFAGSGALGVEALSRGAASAVFVEPDQRTRGVIEENLGLVADAPATIVAGTAAAHLATCGKHSYDLVFADPPYVFDDWAELFDLLGRAVAPDGVVVVESDRSIDPGRGWEIFREKRYGSTVVGINVRSAAAPLPGAEM